MSSPRCHLSEGPPRVPQVCPGRGLDPVRVVQDCQLVPSPILGLQGTRFIEGEEGGSRAEGRGVKHRPPRLRSGALRPRRGAAVQAWNEPRLPQLAAFHGSRGDGPGEKGQGQLPPGVAPKTHGAPPRFPGVQRDKLDTSELAGEAHRVQTGARDVGEGVARGMEAGWSADGSLWPPSLGDQERLDRAGRGGPRAPALSLEFHSPLHPPTPPAHTHTLGPLLQIGGLRALPARTED